MRILIFSLMINLLFFFQVEANALSKTRKGTQPYECTQLKLIGAKGLGTAGAKERKYAFTGSCIVKVSKNNYKEIWLEISGKYNISRRSAEESAKIIAGGKGSIIIEMQCHDDPWITNAKCIVASVKNASNYPSLGQSFRLRGIYHPPIARGVANFNHALALSKQAAARTPPPPPPPPKKPGDKKKMLQFYPGAKPQQKQMMQTKKLVPAAKQKQPMTSKMLQMQQQQKVFASPKYKGYMVDYCFYPAKSCGKFVADSWCRTKGYKQAKSFSIAHNIGTNQPTYILGAKMVCHHPSCDGFKTIVCVK